MKNRIINLIIVTLLCSSLVFAGDWNAFGSLPEIDMRADSLDKSLEKQNNDGSEINKDLKLFYQYRREGGKLSYPEYVEEIYLPEYEYLPLYSVGTLKLFYKYRSIGGDLVYEDYYNTYIKKSSV